MDGLDIDRRRAALLSRDENLDGSNKHCLLQIAWRTRKINEFHLNILLSNIKAQTDFCDWNLCQAVRLLFFEYDADMVGVLDCIRSELRSFPFWPMVSLEYCNNSFCYWSENHSFMFLSSAYLFQQIERGGRGPPRGRETAILRAALMAKLRGGPGKGLYEVLSHVYLPYTFCAMLNLIDFANDRDIVDMATAIADAIAYQFALATSDQGVVSLTASARYFARCRLRTFDHNVNQLMLIMAGIPVTFKIDSVTGFVLTSRYRPDSSIDFNKLIREERLILQWPMNHVANNLDDICAVYPDLTEEERVPFYW